MAITRKPPRIKNGSILKLTEFTKKLKTFLKPENLWDLWVNPDQCFYMAVALFISEIFINFFVIAKVNYTEIDWIAYMQEVEGVKNGTYDYSLLEGDTGPLVYPAGFVWIFWIFHSLTDAGTNIKLAQCLFAVIFLLNTALVFRLYCKSGKVPPYALAFMTLISYRVHSIFVLRLFNDPVAMVLLYAALNLFADNYWSLGSVFFSLAVSVKMNILLFAPALLLAYLATQGLIGTIIQLAICGGLQVLLALPFLLDSPVNYLRGAFNLGRIFVHTWTVNYRFVPEWLFINPWFHTGLFLVHALLLLAAAKYFWHLLKEYAKLNAMSQKPAVAIQLFLLPLFLSNFIGIVAARSLHYQFYVWYYHQLPYLLWCTSLPEKMPVLKLLILGLIELCWNTYPSTWWSSATLHGCHIVMLVSIFMYMNRILQISDQLKKKAQEKAS